MGYASTELLTEEEMTELVSRAAANARNIENEDEVFIFPGSPKYGTPNAKFSEPATAAEVRENVLSLQKQQYGASDMVTDGTKSGAFTGTTEIYLYNSYGLELSNRVGVSAAYVAPVLKNGEESDNDFDFAVGKTAAEMGDLAARTVGRVKEKFGAGAWNPKVQYRIRRRIHARPACNLLLRILREERADGACPALRARRVKRLPPIA